MLKLPADKGPLIASLITLAGPIALQNLIGSSLNLVDNVMIGSLGATSIAGVALANQIFFLLILFSFAIGSGTAIFTAQFWGKGDHPAIRRSLGLCLTFMMSGSLLFFAAAQIAPGFLIGIFSTDPEVIATGSRFLRIMSWGFLFQAVTMSYVNVLRSIERVRMPLVASVVSLALCTFLNWVLIFGNLGLPALGVEGSAIATVIARALEMSIIVGSVYLRRQPDGSPHHLAASPRELLGFDREYLGKFWKVTLPVVGNEMGWALGFTIPTIVFARMGTESIAAYNIADTAIRLVLVVFFGTTSANAVLVGKRIGEGKEEEARATAKFFGLLAPAMGATLALVLAGCSLFVPLFFNVDDTVRSWARTGMLIFALDMPLRAFNWHVIIGILRAGGDTTYSMVLDVGGTWLVSVPLCLLAGLVLGLPVWLVYAATLVEDIPKVFMGIARLKSGKWLNNLTHREPSAGV
jgi:putative MATE family efflux protein